MSHKMNKWRSTMVSRAITFHKPFGRTSEHFVNEWLSCVYNYTLNWTWKRHMHTHREHNVYLHWDNVVNGIKATINLTIFNQLVHRLKWFALSKLPCLSSIEVSDCIHFGSEWHLHWTHIYFTIFHYILNVIEISQFILLCYCHHSPMHAVAVCSVVIFV